MCGWILLALAQGGENISFDKLYKQLEKHEGKRAKVYKDSHGIKTIGIGFNLERQGAKKAIEDLGLNYAKILAGDQTLSEEQIQKLFKMDVEQAVKSAKDIVPNYDDLSDVRKRVVVDMIFNLGPAGFKAFKKMIAALKEKDFNKAASEMKDSQWYTQVGDRAKTLVKMMMTDSD
jgi:GH24 family phage-related lysozyme (muramidase)